MLRLAARCIVPQEVSAAVEAIGKYLDAFPAAKDTVEGAQFWCVRYGVVASRGVVQEALTRLVDQGVVRRQSPSRSGRVVYSRFPNTEDGGEGGRTDESQARPSESSARMFKEHDGISPVRNQVSGRSKRIA